MNNFLDLFSRCRTFGLPRVFQRAQTQPSRSRSEDQLYHLSSMHPAMQGFTRSTMLSRGRYYYLLWSGGGV